MFELDLPPSVNEQYIKTRYRPGMKSGIALSEIAKKYRNHVKDVVSQNLVVVTGQFPTGDESLVYQMEIELRFEKLEFESWFEKFTRGAHAGERKAKARFVNVDEDNRIKFVRDAICKTINIPDDRQIFETTVRKVVGPKGATVTLSLADERRFLCVSQKT